MTAADKEFEETRSGESMPSTHHPVGHPIASTTPDPSPLATPRSSRIGAANDGAHTGTTPASRSRRTRTTDVAAIDARLSDRDRAILQSVAEHQFLTGQQLTALHFHDHTPTSGPRIARRVLARLRELRVLGALERRVGGIYAGSSGLVHHVDVVGDQLLRGRSGRTARRSREPSARFLAHRLAVADHHLALLTADRARQLEVIDCTVEPASWRRYVGTGGTAVTLKSDLYTETGAGEDLVHAWFIEVDRGTESLLTLLRKCRDYETYRRSGIEQDRTGGFPVVIWSVTHRNPEKAETRRQNLRDALAADHFLPPQLFRVIAPQQLIPLLQRGGQQ